MPTRPYLVPRWLLLVLAGLGACAPARFVKPLDAGQQAVSVSLGGPLIGYGSATIPMPFLTAAYGRGFTPTLTGFGAVNITSALYGNAQLELGLTKQLLPPRGWVPGMSVSPAATLLYHNQDAFNVYPTLDAYAFWEYHRRQAYVYAGLTGSRLIMYGFSLGSAPAVKLTAQPRSLTPAKLLLEAPYASAQAITQDAAGLALPGTVVTNLSLNNGELIKQVAQPLCWLHGTDDHYLSLVTQGEAVYNSYQGAYKEAHRVAGAHHSDVPVYYPFRTYARTWENLFGGEMS